MGKRTIQDEGESMSQLNNVSSSSPQKELLKLLCFSACLLISPSCSFGVPSDQPELGQVSGVVTLDGQPLSRAKISFDPISGGRSSMAVTDDQGRYELEYAIQTPGAKVDRHNIRVSTEWDEGEASSGSKPTKETIPQKYREPGGLTGEVKPGKNVIDLKLVSE